MPASFIFDGTDDRLNYGDVTIFDGLTEFSYSAWVRWDSKKGGQGFYGKSTSVSTRFYSYIESSETHLFMNLDGSNGARDAMYWDFWFENTTIGVWYHYVFTWKGGTVNNWKLYVDGDSKTLGIFTVGNGDSVPSNSDPLILGDLTTGGTWDFEGGMADVKFFNRELSQNEVLELMFYPNSIVDGLIFDAPLRDSLAKDLISGSTPTITGATTDSSGPPVSFKKLKV